MRQPRPSDQRGQSMVEFALIGPTLLLLALMVVQAGLYINARATIDNATREGARVAAMCGGSIAASMTYQGVRYSNCTAAVQGAVDGHLGFLQVAEPSTSAVVLECAPPPATGKCTGGTYAPRQGDSIQVSVDFAYDFYLGTLLGNSAPFQADIGSDAIVVSQQ